MTRLNEVIAGETAEAFLKRVEQFYAYTIKPGEKWVLYGDLLIVTHPDRAPIKVHEGGRIEEINPNDNKRET